jgi:hypothetical protein
MLHSRTTAAVFMAGSMATVLICASASGANAQEKPNTYANTGMSVTGPASEKSGDQFGAAAKASRDAAASSRQATPDPAMPVSPGASTTSGEEAPGVNSAARNSQ